MRQSAALPAGPWLPVRMGFSGPAIAGTTSLWSGGLAHRGGDAIRPLSDAPGVAPLDHDPDHRLRAGRAQQDASRTVEVRLGLRDRALDVRVLQHAVAALYRYVDQHLRKELQRAAGLRERGAVLDERA